MNTRLVLRLAVAISLLAGMLSAAPVTAQNPIPNFYSSVSITNIAGAPVVNGIFSADVVISVANYGGSSQVGIIATDIYVTYDQTMVRFAYLEPRSSFFTNPSNYTTQECPAGYIPPNPNILCLRLAFTQQPGSGPVYNKTGTLATLYWTGVASGVTVLDVLGEYAPGLSYSNLIQYPDNTPYPFTAITPATIVIGWQGGGAGAIHGRVLRYGYRGSTLPTVTAAMSGGPTVPAVIDANGYFTITVPNGGNYTVRATYPGYLTAQKDNAYVSGAMIEIGTTYMRGGDVNTDNYVNIFDLVLIAAWMGGYNDLADINDDGRVDIFDLTLAAGSFNQRGPTAW